ncbi:hypothetical protein ACO1O0_004729 [Amphichorda felina]
MSCPVRTYPLKRPDGHQPPVPRWQLIFGPGLTHVRAAYIGVQRHVDTNDATAAADLAVRSVQSWIGGDTQDDHPVVEEFHLIDGNDAPGSHIWVCYWTDESTYKSAMDRLSLAKIYADLPSPGRSSIGIWSEVFTIPVSRIETNYTGLDYLPGVGRLPNTTTEPHTLTAYWGAARDRIPDAAHDLFSADVGAEEVVPGTAPTGGLGQHLVGSNGDNLVHIRSGQFWENCDEQESEAYERKLEPTLEAGLRYLWENPADSGARGLRYLRNTTEGSGSAGATGGKRKETCVTGFFTSLDKLEGWAKSHKSHLAIYNGAMRHAKTFGDGRRFRTWHEVVVLKRGEAKYEYVNCVGGTGMMQFAAPDEAS